MGDKTGIEWTEATWNPVTGCDRISPGCENCLDPATPVLMADMRWKPIGKVEVGDLLVSFTEAPSVGQNRVYETAAVEHVWTTRAEAVELTVGDRSIIASADHRFLAPTRPSWRTADSLGLDSLIVDIGMPGWVPNVDTEAYRAGYVAGVIGGDGTMRIDGSGKGGTKQSYMRVADPETDMPLLERFAASLVALGCSNIAIRPFDQGPGSSGFAPKSGVRAPMAKVETRRMDNLLLIADQCLPERDDPNWAAGFLAGFLDTDGSYSGGNLRFNQSKDNDLLDVTVRCIDRLGFKATREDFRSAEGRSVRLAGDVTDKVRFLSCIQPALTRKAADFYGRRFPKAASPVDGVRRLGVRDLVDIQTSTGTFIAAGLATHNCYALALAKRLKAMGSARYQTDGDPRTSGPGFGVATHADALDQPLRWKRPRRIFVNSMSDLFHDQVTVDFVVEVFAVMALASQHTFQVLTKRPQRMAKVVGDPGFREKVEARIGEYPIGQQMNAACAWPLPNVWLGTSIESDRYTFRADHLRATPAAVRFLSCEPLLGPLPSLDLTGIDQVIVGGESGPGARPMHPDWVRDLRDRCQAATVPCPNDTDGDGDCWVCARPSQHVTQVGRHPQPVPFFFKQWGAWVPVPFDDDAPDQAPAGRWLNADGGHGFHGRDVVRVANVGKRAAGRELDGRTWDETP